MKLEIVYDWCLNNFEHVTLKKGTHDNPYVWIEFYDFYGIEYNGDGVTLVPSESLRLRRVYEIHSGLGSKIEIYGSAGFNSSPIQLIVDLAEADCFPKIKKNLIKFGINLK